MKEFIKTMLIVTLVVAASLAAAFSIQELVNKTLYSGHNYCACRTYCLDKYCSNCGKEQPKTKWIKICASCGDRVCGQHCSSCGGDPWEKEVPR